MPAESYWKLVTLPVDSSVIFGKLGIIAGIGHDDPVPDSVGNISQKIPIGTGAILKLDRVSVGIDNSP